MAQPAAALAKQPASLVTFDTHPSRYRHWKLAFDGPLAILTMNVDEAGGLRPGYALKLNSYDLGMEQGVDEAFRDVCRQRRLDWDNLRSVLLAQNRIHIETY